ncbi:hypothetical protein EVAR_73180_1 [Eumeta japonica]|uniref:Uncharacterized protein n=1 Tax=Eumeta variegata TaxID=151549 RepID=A0A4C1SCA7_EUMVA|nr:hypothetical protein EVAR_73180_1 [Eumeta japonica]
MTNIRQVWFEFRFSENLGISKIYKTTFGEELIKSIKPMEIGIKYKASPTVNEKWIEEGQEAHHYRILTAKSKSITENVPLDRILETKLAANCQTLISDIHPG